MKKLLFVFFLFLEPTSQAFAKDMVLTPITLKDCDHDAKFYGAILTTEYKCDIEFIDVFKEIFSQNTEDCIKKYGSKRIARSISEGIEAIKLEIYTTGLKSTCDLAVEKNVDHVK